MRAAALRWGTLFLAACAGGNSAYSCSGYQDPSAGGGGPASDSALLLLAPNGDESWTGGDTVDIEWEVEDAPSVTIEILRAGAVARSYEDVPNTGIFAWQVPVDLATSEDYAVRVTAETVDAADESDAPFAIRNWRMRRELLVTLGDDGRARAVLDLAAGDPILATAGEGGAELRFAGDANRAAGFDLAHFVERWDGTGARVWFELPQGDLARVFLFWDSPGAASASSLPDVFPNRYESTGSGSIASPSMVVDAFIVNPGHTLTVAPGSPLVVEASLIRVSGTLDASGAGHAGGQSLGAGPGGGTGSPDAAGGGGSYGGWGGWGGAMYADENPGEPGSPYGVMEDAHADMGSGGGGAHSAIPGAAGGGRVELLGTHVSVGGNVFADGMSGGTGPEACGGGGGAGGGIVLAGRSVEITGTLSASGGAGGHAAPPDHYGGGGGGGGRVKLLYTDDLIDSGPIRTSGGANGDGWAPGEPGLSGSVYRGRLSRVFTTVVQGTTETLW